MIGVIFFGIVGSILIYLGMITLNGTYKKWYLGPHIFPPQAIVYGAIPFGISGIGLCLAGIISIFLDFNAVICIVGIFVFPSTIFGFILAAWRPKWIKPHWVRWLEEYYGDKIYILIADAQNNPAVWEVRVSTQAGLEEWAEEVAGKPSR